MREIKFRGRRIDNGEWVYGFLVEGYDATFIVYKAFFDDYRWAFGNVFIQVDPETVGQFTSLHDKNGNRIYEGDIMTSGSGDKLAVVFENGGFCFANDLSSGSDRLHQMRVSRLEIIGNIFENKELLNKAK